MKQSHSFHPKDKSSQAMFWRSHDRRMDKLKAFVEMQAGPNPLTIAERRKLAEKYPDRYGFMVCENV